MKKPVRVVLVLTAFGSACGVPYFLIHEMVLWLIGALIVLIVSLSIIINE